jgi:hypothetical protein
MMWGQQRFWPPPPYTLPLSPLTPPPPLSPLPRTQVHKRSEYARKALGIKGKMFAKKRHAEKVQMKKTIAMHQERDNKHKAEDGVPQNAVPAYLLEREQVRERSIFRLLVVYLRGIALFGEGKGGDQGGVATPAGPSPCLSSCPCLS